jgi:hypothetical protein
LMIHRGAQFTPKLRHVNSYNENISRCEFQAARTRVLHHGAPGLLTRAASETIRGKFTQEIGTRGAQTAVSSRKIYHRPLQKLPVWARARVLHPKAD